MACARSIAAGSSPSSSRWAWAHASSAVSRVITCRRIPKRTSRPAALARVRTASSFSATAGGGSPQVRYTSAYLAATSRAGADDPPR